MNYTEELGLKLPELDESFDLEGHWNYNTEKLDAFAATTNTAVGTLESGLSAAQSQIAALQGGVHLKGSVNYYADLPEDPDDGDAYTVLYFGTSGQEPAGIEYAWVDNSQSWIPIGVDPAAFAKPADVTAAIAALDVTETGGSGKYISAISETNGKISATPTTFDTSLSSSSTDGNAPTSKTVYDDQQRQEVEIGDIANRGAKNLCPKETETSTGSGFTSDVPVSIPAGTYILSFTGTLAYTASLSFYRALPHSGNNLLNVNLEAKTGEQSIVFTIAENAKYIAFYHNGSGNSLTSIMIRPAAITDTSYQPYARTNRDLTVENDSQQSEIDYAINTGAKSLLPIGVSSIRYYSAVTFSVADDGQITVNGTNPNTNNGIVYQDIVTAKTSQTETRYTLPVGRYKITETGTNGLRFQVHCHDGTNTYELHSSSNSGEFSYTESLKSQYPYICWRILIVAKSSFSNHVVKPMIWDAAITDPTFKPFARTNRELTVLTDEDRAALVDLVDSGAKNVAQTNDITQTGNGFFNTDPISGDLFVSAATVSTTASSSTFAIVFYYTDGTISPTRQLPITNSLVHEFNTGEKVVERVRIFAGDTTEASSGNTITLTNFMICTAADWAVSQKFVPYRPSWQEMANEIETKATINNVYGFGTAIPSNSNLNNYKTPGVYRIESSTIADTISNLPTGASAGRLEVKGLNAADRYLQIYYSGDVIFQRRWNGSSWFTWYKFEGTAVT